MNAAILAVPIVLVRYVFMAVVSKSALARAGFFPPVKGIEKTAFYVYQVTTLFLLLYLFFAQVHFVAGLNYLGGVLFLSGLVLYAKSILDFAKPRASGINMNGLYRFSRNPMYAAFFLYFLGCSLLINSWLYFGVLAVFQVSVHYLILSEERWCRKEFGAEYEEYTNKVRRYL